MEIGREKEHEMDRREFLKSCAAVGAGGGVVLSNRGMKLNIGAKPNVVLVMTDDQGYFDLACHGNPDIHTPNIDKLFSESVRLTDFHVSPTCSPTRAALMTGRYNNRTGVWHTIMGRSLIRKDEVTMADVFADSDYRTGFFGKWHLGDNYPFRPQDRGFDYVVMHGGGGVGQGPDYWGNTYFDDMYFRNGVEERFAGYCTDIWFDEGMKFIERNKDRPFFCYIPTNAPHGPLNVAEKYSQPYVDKGVSSNQAKFYGMITNIDENMGLLMTQLEQLGLEKNTILVWMTDNGSSAGYKVINRGGKGSQYDGGHRVPCFVRWPGADMVGGRDVTKLTAHIDLLPTFIELCNLKNPAGVAFDGASIAQLLRGDESGWGDRTLVVDSQRIENPEKWRKSAVMTDRWRLVDQFELYDMENDIGQENDVAGEPANAAIVAQLQQSYNDWWDSISERFDEYCEIIIGSDEQNPTRLMSHDWHEEALHSQSGVASGSERNGFWAVEIDRAGTYEFELCRWPVEVNAPITAAIPDGTAIAADTARLKIANIDVNKPVTASDVGITFQVQLSPQKTTLQTWFTDSQSGQSRGAYYVYARRV